MSQFVIKVGDLGNGHYAMNTLQSRYSNGVSAHETTETEKAERAYKWLYIDLPKQIKSSYELDVEASTIKWFELRMTKRSFSNGPLVWPPLFSGVQTDGLEERPTTTQIRLPRKTNPAVVNNSGEQPTWMWVDPYNAVPNRDKNHRKISTREKVTRENLLCSKKDCHRASKPFGCLKNLRDHEKFHRHIVLCEFPGCNKEVRQVRYELHYKNAHGTEFLCDWPGCPRKNTAFSRLQYLRSHKKRHTEPGRLEKHELIPATSNQATNVLYGVTASMYRFKQERS